MSLPRKSDYIDMIQLPSKLIFHLGSSLFSFASVRFMGLCLQRQAAMRSRMPLRACPVRG